MGINLNKFVGQRIPCSCGKEHFIPTKKIIIEKDVIHRLPSFLQESFAGKHLLLVADPITDKVAAEQIATSLNKNGFTVEKKILRGENNRSLVADQAHLEELLQIIKPEINYLLAVGSGTINDLTKLAATKKNKPYLVFPTAPSMNGYTSPVGSLFIKGNKSTFPADPPVLVVADIEILKQAPVEMVRSGLADLISKPIACTDWRLASLLKNEYYCSLPLKMVSQAEELYLKKSQEIGSRQEEAIVVLFQGLLLAGFSMVVAGSSSPASGAEHLLSHHWDTEAYRQGKPMGLHGLQVGVSTLVISKLYEKVLGLESERFNKVSGNWPTICQELKQILTPSALLREILLQAGAPVTIKQLGISRRQLEEAFFLSKNIRARYTILDLAGDLGILKEIAEQVFEESGVLWENQVVS